MPDKRLIAEVLIALTFLAAVGYEDAQLLKLKESTYIALPDNPGVKLELSQTLTALLTNQRAIFQAVSQCQKAQ